MAIWTQGVVRENIHWTDNLFTLKIEADIGKFTAGQFTSLALDIDGERIARPYSILSAPGEQPLEFFFYTAIDGVLSNALVALSPGDVIWVKHQANGFFTLDEVPGAKDLWMLGTGTGVAPFFSMLGTDEPWQRFDNVILVHAVRSQSDLRYDDLVAALHKKHDKQFHYKAFVSRENIPGTIHGRIPGALTDKSLEQVLHIPLSPEYSQIMLCGNPDMVKDSVQVLKARQFRKNRRRTPGHITVENYW